MYSKKVVERNLKRASEILIRTHGLPKGWRLKRSSAEEIAEMREHFEALLDDKGMPVRKLTREEELWVLCECTLCKLDFEYYYENYVRIEDWSGRVAGFRPNRSQRLFLRMLAANEERGLAQMYMFLKARQLGITTIWQILLSHRVFFYRNITAPTGSAEPEKSRAMVGKLEFIWENLPWWLRPQRTVYRAGELLEYGKQNSRITVHWGNQKQGIARGSTSVVAHLSELASFVNAESLVDAALMRTMHENAFSLLGLESTAEGIGNWWHKTWEFNKKMDGQGLARLKPVFLPWYLGTDLYPTEAALKRRPVPEGWRVPGYIEEHALAAKVYVESDRLLKGELGDGWEMPIEQKWFYYLEYEEAKAKGTLNKFLAEMPASDMEAFQSSNPTIFDIEVLNGVNQRTRTTKAIGVYSVEGGGISEIYSVGMGTGEKSLLAKCRKPGGEVVSTFNLRPVRMDAWPDLDPGGKLYVWEWPQLGEEYGIGVDPSEGVGQDYSVISVIKKATPWHPDVQVAEWASNKVGPHDLWSFVYAIGNVYTVKARDGRLVQPRVVVETNIAAGDAVQSELLKRGWTNFHQQVDLTKGNKKGKNRVRLDIIGWKTTKGTRPKLISIARKMIRDRQFVVSSPWLAMEMATLEYNLDRARIEASVGNHDDRFIASALVLASWYDPEVYGSAPSAWLAEREWEAKVMEDPVYVEGTVVGQKAGVMVPKRDMRDSRGAGYSGL